MKLPTRIAGEEILFVNHEDLAAQLEQKVLDLDKRLAEQIGRASCRERV